MIDVILLFYKMNRSIRNANLIVAIGYSAFVMLLFLASVGAVKQEPLEPFAVLFICGPVLMNWLSFRNWRNAASQTRQFNLLVGVIYTFTFAADLFVALLNGKASAILGVAIYCPPIVLNWLSYRYWAC
jgi:hypothetical protein